MVDVTDGCIVVSGSSCVMFCYNVSHMYICCVAMCFVEKMLLHILEQCFTVVLPKLSWVQYNSEAPGSIHESDFSVV